MASSAAMKIDLFKEHKHEYVQKKSPCFVDVGPAQYLASDGAGAPGGDEFQAAVGALYAIAYTIKMTSKKSGRDYVVSKLEGLWESSSGEAAFDPSVVGECAWTLLIRTPDFIDTKNLAAASEKIAARNDCAEAANVRLEELNEGRCIQMLHVGPYEHEGETIQRMRMYCESEGVRFSGSHHEIYLSDPRRVEPEHLKTILRYPVS